MDFRFRLVVALGMYCCVLFFMMLAFLPHPEERYRLQSLAADRCALGVLIDMRWQSETGSRCMRCRRAATLVFDQLESGAL